MNRLKSLALLPLTFWHEYLDMFFFFQNHSWSHIGVNDFKQAMVEYYKTALRLKSLIGILEKCVNFLFKKGYEHQISDIKNWTLDI